MDLTSAQIEASVVQYFLLYFKDVTYLNLIINVDIISDFIEIPRLFIALYDHKNVNITNQIISTIDI